MSGRNRDIPLQELDLEDQSKKSSRSVGFAANVLSDSESDEDREFQYSSKSRRHGGYSQVESGDLSTTAAFSHLDDDGEGKGKGKRKRKSRSGRHSNRRQSRPQEPRLLKMGLIILVPIILLLGMFFLVSMSSSNESKNVSPVVAPTGFSYPSGFNIKNNWGSLSPYFQSGTPFAGAADTPMPGATIQDLPHQCSLKQVHVLHRHAERYPTPGIGASMEAFAKKLKDMDQSTSKVFEWVDDWEYKLKTDLLVASGVGTEFESGSDFWASHGQMLFNSTEKGFLFYDPSLNVYENGTSKPLPVVRATTQSRIQTSARSWAAGFFGIYGDDPARTSAYDPSKLYNLILQEEADGQNNTLAGYFSCPNAYNDSYVPGTANTNQWIDIYLAEAAVRIQKLLPGFSNLTAYDVYCMQNLCAFETAAYGSSPFCSLFTETEWRGFEYTFDLDFYGSCSHGSAVGAAEGTGWVSELVARLEKKYITEPNYGVNVSFTNNEAMFPLNQSLYVDFTHDSVIVSVLSAIGFEFLKEKLPPTKIPVPRQFIISRLTPFGARMYVEILSCKGDSKDTEEQFARIKLNNRVLPLNSLKSCPQDKSGLCPYSKFVDSLKHALKQIDFDTACYGEPKNWSP